MNLTERLRGIVKPATVVAPQALPDVGSAFLGPPKRDEREGGRPTSSIEETLGGEWRGSCFVVERRVGPDTTHGRCAVGEIADRLAAAADHAPLVARGAPARQPFMFFDLETTGLSGGAGTYAFLVGCGSFDATGSFVTKQYVMATFGDERPILEALATDLAGAGALVTFNGKSFDAPLIETRFLFHRLGWPGANLPHVDVLHPARRFWGEPGPPNSCSLVDLEAHLLGVRRTSDVSGCEIPSRYFQFLRSGDARPLGLVLEHNRLDLLSLAGLAARLLHLAAAGPMAVVDAREAVALGHVYAQAGLDARARQAFGCALEMSERGPHTAMSAVRIAALHALALCERRARRYEEAASRWRALLAVPGCPPHLARHATEALAIHHEHRVRDLAAARAFALRSLDGASTSAWREAMHRRVTRINRKMNERLLLD